MPPFPQKLWDAVQNGKLDTVQKLVDRNTSLIHSQTDDGAWTLMHHACWHGHLSVVQLLWERGAAIDSSGDSGWKNTLQNTTFPTKGWTPLHAAAANGHVGLVAFLLECAATNHTTRGLVDAVDDTGCTAAHVAALGGHTTILVYCLGDPGAKGSSPDGGSRRGASANDLRSNKATTNLAVAQTDKRGATVLHMALRGGHVDTAVALVRAYPFLLFVKDYQHKSALDVANGDTALALVQSLAVSSYSSPLATTVGELHPGLDRTGKHTEHGSEPTKKPHRWSFCWRFSVLVLFLFALCTAFIAASLEPYEARYILYLLLELVVEPCVEHWDDFLIPFMFAFSVIHFGKMLFTSSS